MERNRILRTTIKQKMRRVHDDLGEGLRAPERADDNRTKDGLRHVHEDLRRGWRAPERAELQRHDSERERN